MRRAINNVLLIITVSWSAFITWAMSKLSRYVIYHDDVWSMMVERGFQVEHLLAEILASFGMVFFLPLVLAAGVYLFVSHLRRNRSSHGPC
jgi:hypothetical protein